MKLRKNVICSFCFSINLFNKMLVLMKIVALLILILCCAYYNSMWPYSWIGRSLKCVSPIYQFFNHSEEI